MNSARLFSRIRRLISFCRAASAARLRSSAARRFSASARRSAAALAAAAFASARRRSSTARRSLAALSAASLSAERCLVLSSAASFSRSRRRLSASATGVGTLFARLCCPPAGAPSRRAGCGTGLAPPAPRCRCAVFAVSAAPAAFAARRLRSFAAGVTRRSVGRAACLPAAGCTDPTVSVRAGRAAGRGAFGGVRGVSERARASSRRRPSSSAKYSSSVPAAFLLSF